MNNNLLVKQKDIIQNLGIGVVLPKLNIKAKAKSHNFNTFLSLDKILEYDLEIESIFKQMQKHKKLNKYDILKLTFNDEIELDSEIESFLKDIFSIKEFPLPPLNANLREYQKKVFFGQLIIF